MGTEDQDGIGRDFFNGFDENGAAAAELFHNVGVVDDFVMHVDRRAIGFER
jgi:hypothetical protein